MASIAYDVALILLQARTPADGIFGNDRRQSRTSVDPLTAIDEREAGEWSLTAQPRLGLAAAMRPPSHAAPATNRFRILPRFSISVSMTSPGARKVFVPWPTPPQVPQLKTSPVSIVRMFEAYSICSSGVKMNCEVLPFCFTSPLTERRMNRFIWSGTKARGTKKRPIGANLSWLLPPSQSERSAGRSERIWRSRQETSLV